MRKGITEYVRIPQEAFLFSQGPSRLLRAKDSFRPTNSLETTVSSDSWFPSSTLRLHNENLDNGHTVSRGRGKGNDRRGSKLEWPGQQGE